MSVQPADVSEAFFRAVREAVRSGRHTDSQSLASLLTQAEGVLKAQKDALASSGATSDAVLYERDVSSLAHIVVTVLHDSSDEGLHRRCLALLGSLGEAGEVYAVNYLFSGQARPDVLAGMVQAMPPERRLLLLNAILRRPRSVASNVSDALLDPLRRNLSETINEDPEEGLVLLDTLGKRGEVPCSAVQHAMLGSRFGLWLEELLRMDLDAAQLGYMATAVTVLRARGLSSLLVRHWPRMRREELIPLIRCFGKCADPADDRIRQLLLGATAHKMPEVRDAALEALVNMGVADVDKPLAATLAESGVTPALCALLLRLDADILKNVFRLIGSGQRPELVARLGVILSAFDQQRLLSLLRELEIPASRTATPEAASAFVRGFISSNANVQFTPFHDPPMPRTEPPRDESIEDTGGLLSNVRSFFVREKKPDDTPHPLSMVQNGMTVSGRQFAPGSITQLALRDVTFTDCTFTQLDISYCSMIKVRFERCRLHSVRLTESRLSQVVFVDCELACMPADRCLMDKVRFEQTLLDVVDLGECRFSGCAFSNCTVRATRLWGAVWRMSTFSLCFADCTDFGCTVMRDAVLDGSLFGDCVFIRSDIRDVQAHGTLFSACSASMCRAQTVMTQAPFLLEMTHNWSREALLAIAGDTDGQVLPAANAALYLLLQRWLRVEDAGRRAMQMLAQNRRRLDWCRAKLGKHGDFVRILPLLLQSSMTPAPSGIVAGVPCHIRDYVPHRAALDSFLRRFDASFIHEEYASLTVEAVYLAGAAGSIGQTAGSPLDVWVVHSAGKAGETGDAENAAGDSGNVSLLQAFREKLDHISHWARMELRLTVRFQLVHVDSIRLNAFGFESTDGSDSAGSSQSLLLKAELYRFMILLAGRMPAWWCTPVGLTDAEYSARLPYVSKAVHGEAPLDLGPLETIPRAAMQSCLFWYIARALSVPFMSMLVFGQLESGVAGAQLASGDAVNQPVLLCNRIKQRLHDGVNGLWDVDPLAVALRDMYAFYQAEGRVDVLDLIRQAFLRKCGYATTVSTATIRSAETLHLGAEFLEYYMPFSEDPVGRKLADPVMQGDDSLPTLLEMSELGERLNNFLLATYVRVSEQLGIKNVEPVRRDGETPGYSEGSVPSGSGLSGDDMTMAGRKIFAWLEPRPYKIMRLPFIEPPCRFIESLEFICELSPSHPPVWMVQARLPKLAGRKAARETLRSEKSPVKLFSWLIANEFWCPGMHISGASLAPHVGISDIQDALDALYALCAPQSFDRPWGEYLCEEAMVRAGVLVNFGAPKEVRKLESGSLLYLTNWGELFCLPDIPGVAALGERAAQAVRALVHCPVAPGAHLTLYAPQRFPVEIERDVVF